MAIVAHSPILSNAFDIMYHAAPPGCAASARLYYISAQGFTIPGMMGGQEYTHPYRRTLHGPAHWSKGKPAIKPYHGSLKRNSGYRAARSQWHGFALLCWQYDHDAHCDRRSYEQWQCAD